MKGTKIIAAVVFMVLVVGCIVQLPETAPEQPPDMKSSKDSIPSLKGLPIDEFFEEPCKQALLRNPELLTALGISEWYGRFMFFINGNQARDYVPLSSFPFFYFFFWLFLLLPVK
jgi:hypothetical protein